MRPGNIAILSYELRNAASTFVKVILPIIHDPEEVMATLQAKYRKEIIPAMRGHFGYRNIMAVPRIDKVVINVGVGRMRDEKQHAAVIKAITLITGQKPSPCPAKKAIAAFKTRKGLIVGYKTTLRGKMMWDFILRLIGIAMPRQRDFRGISEDSFDTKGNLTVGFKEHIVFPEMIGEDVPFIFGFEVTVITTANRREEGIELLKLLGFPIKTDK